MRLNRLLHAALLAAFVATVCLVPASTQSPSVLYVATSSGPTPVAGDTYGGLFVRSDHPNRVNCVLTTAATTSTAITGCTAPGVGLAIYITDIEVYGGVAVGATAAATIQTGTGGTCGSSTTILDYCQHGATAGCVANLTVPKRALTNGELCLLDATTGTKFVAISGFIAP